MADIPLLGWGFSGLTRRLRNALSVVNLRLDIAEDTLDEHDDRLETAEGALAEHDGRLDTIETWAARIKGFSESAPTPGQNTQVGDIYLATTPTAGGYIGWVAVTVDEQIVFRGFGAISSS